MITEIPVVESAWVLHDSKNVYCFKFCHACFNSHVCKLQVLPRYHYALPLAWYMTLW